MEQNTPFDAQNQNSTKNLIKTIFFSLDLFTSRNEFLPQNFRQFDSLTQTKATFHLLSFPYFQLVVLPSKNKKRNTKIDLKNVCRFPIAVTAFSISETNLNDK